MKAVVLQSWPDDRVSRLRGVGVSGEIPAYWSEVRNAEPQELSVGDVVEFDIHLNGGQSFYTNIRILAGDAERN